MRIPSSEFYVILSDPFYVNSIKFIFTTHYQRDSYPCIVSCVEFCRTFTVTPIYFFPSGSAAPNGPGSPHYRGFMITLRHTTLGRTPLDEWSGRRRDLYLTTHKHSQETDIHAPGGIRTQIQASEGPQTHALELAVTVTHIYISLLYIRI
jgi:hypothetical protein